MAQGKPPALRLMAAMAQQDCGQCGYNCADYANALFLKKEERLTLCAPGGKETARMLKQLAAEIGAHVATPAIVTDAGAGRASRGAVARQSGRGNIPVAPPAQRRRALPRRPGTSSSISAPEASTTSSATVSASFPRTIRRLPIRLSPRSAPIRVAMWAARALREAMIADVSLGAAPDNLFQLLSYVLGGERRAKARALASGEDPDGDAATLDVLAALRKVRRRAARSGGVPRGARSAGAAALFDLVVAEGRSRAASR